MNYKKVGILFGALLSFSCYTEAVAESSNKVLGIWPSTEKTTDFFCSDNKNFFPIDNWMLNFNYNKETKKLEITHLNVKISENAKCDVIIENGTIFIKEKDKAFSKKGIHDIAFEIADIEPTKYKLNVDNKTYDLDLSNINKKWNYSLMENGSLMIAMFDQEADANEK